ncbi:MAG: MFS transporter [Phycisphaerales bacterium]|nr:MFS transporter [Phycisphaerales bacterium]
MNESTSEAISDPLPQPTLARAQWRALIAAWLGWAFDGLDGFLYVMVGRPFVRELVAAEHGIDPTAPDAATRLAPLSDDITLKFTIIGAVFLVGWAIGGAVFGRIGDRLGRSRTLTLTVLTYALFTGLCFFAQTWWQLMIFRFIAALGIGGEWAAGSALVSETLPKRHRHWASAALQSGYMIGCIAAALTSRWLSGFEYRTVFLIGVVPALMTVWIRWAVPEPEQWRRQAATQRPPPVSAVFSRGLWKTTVLTILLAGVPLTTVWAFWLFLPEVIRAIPEVAAWQAAGDRERVQSLIVNVTIVSLVFNIVGNFFSTYLARFVGYRGSFAFMFLAGLACFAVGFHTPPTLSTIGPIACITSFFILGVFGMFPMYVPRLFPTLLRTLGCGITYNTGRLLAAAGTFGAGWLMIQAGGASGALWWVGMLYIPGIVVAMMCVVPREGDSEDDVGGL